jgi:hypothetical protein
MATKVERLRWFIAATVNIDPAAVTSDQMERFGEGLYAVDAEAWNALTQPAFSASTSSRRFWCVFDGTWDANPSVTPGDAFNVAASLTMTVWAPNAAGSTWQLDTAQQTGTDTGNTGSPYEATVTSYTTTTDGAIAISGSAWSDNVNCNVYSANGWTTAFVGHDNAQGTGLCVSVLYKIMASAGATGAYDLAATAGGYNDALRWCTASFKEITSATKYLKLFAHSSAASATAVEGVVLNAARDTVIGEFTGQAFEATLESGEAVLLVPVEDITPDGSTLTTADTPLVFAYNTTDATAGPGTATVIEV